MKSKYGNIKTEVDGIKFDSKREASYYGTLKMMKLAGEIDTIQLQVKYDLVVNGISVGFYKVDFVTYKNGRVVDVIDVKGIATPIFNLKSKLLKAIYGITIKIVK